MLTLNIDAAHDVKNAAEQAIKVGMSDFLVKPLTAEKTEQVFAKWLTKKPKKLPTLNSSSAKR